MEIIDTLTQIGIDLYKIMSNYETTKKESYKNLITKLLIKERKIVESMSPEDVCDYIATYYEKDVEDIETENDEDIKNNYEKDPFEESAINRLYRLLRVIDNIFYSQQDCTVLNLKSLRELDNKIKLETLTNYNNYKQVKINIEHNLTKNKPYNEFINRYNNSFLYNDANDLYNNEITKVDKLDPKEDYVIINLLISDISDIYDRLISKKDKRIERIDEFKEILKYIPKTFSDALYDTLDVTEKSIIKYNEEEVKKIKNYLNSKGYREDQESEDIPQKYQLREHLYKEKRIYYDNEDLKELDKELNPLLEVGELILNLDKELSTNNNKKNIEMIHNLLKKYLKLEEYYLSLVNNPSQLINYITFLYPLNITTPNLIATSSYNVSKHILDKKYREALISIRIKNKLTKLSINDIPILEDELEEDENVIINVPTNNDNNDKVKELKTLNLLVKLSLNEITQEEFQEEFKKLRIDLDNYYELNNEDKYFLYTHFMMNYIKKINESIILSDEKENVINKKEFKYYLTKSKMLLIFINSFENAFIFNNYFEEDLFKYENFGDEELAEKCSNYMKKILKIAKEENAKEPKQGNNIINRLKEELIKDYELSSIVLLSDEDLKEFKETNTKTRIKNNRNK